MAKSEHKIKWEKLSNEEDMEAKYIYTDGDVGFRESGLRDYERLIQNDDLIKKYLGSFENRTVLEIGCGTGRMTEFMAGAFKKVYAVDISEKMLEAGSKRLKHLDNIEWIETDGKRLPIHVQPDLIFSYIVLQHCPLGIIKTILEDAANTITEDGLVKVQVRGQEIRQDKWYSGHHFTPSEITMLANAAGFQVIQIWHDPEEGRYLWIWGI